MGYAAETRKRRSSLVDSLDKHRREPKEKELFDSVESYGMFIGYPRSGHSLIGALLDAHPNAAIAHELDVLKYVKEGYGREQIYRLLLENSRLYAESGREWNGYRYEVAGQWQGRHEKLTVIGDKKGGGSSRVLASEPELIHQLQDTVGDDVRFIHVVRNPYDNISTMFKGRGRDQNLEAAVERYARLCETNAEIKKRVGADAVLDLRHESFVDDPKVCLETLCRFLNLACEEDYSEACANIVFSSPHKSRHESDWNPEALALVRDLIERYDFLEGYSFED